MRLISFNRGERRAPASMRQRDVVREDQSAPQDSTRWARTGASSSGTWRPFPDIAGSQPPTTLSARPTARVRQLIGDKFPKHIYNSIACFDANVTGAHDTKYF